MIPLFEEYPPLADSLPFVALGNYPTPVLDAGALDSDQQCLGLSIKHDGVSGQPYGGNKVRKLEFLLGEALARGKTDVLTFGGAGSNHALATAIYAQKLGLNTHSLLIKQPNSQSVRNNLLRSLATNARLVHFESTTGLAAAAALAITRSIASKRKSLYIIPPGGTSATGIPGYVNAAFEIRRQISSAALAQPDVIYVACGTQGTYVGLALGLKLLGLETRVCAVAVTGSGFSSLPKAKKLFEKTNSLLSRADSRIPIVRFEDCDLELRHDFYGGEYGRYTQQGMAAVHQLKDATGLDIEGCYTGKCLAALLDDLRSDRLQGKQVLFWNTYDAAAKQHTLTGLDYHQLPANFRPYFEDSVQQLDQ